MDQFFQHLANAAALSGTYALLGIGLTLVFGIMRVVNFTHGEFYALGAYSAYGLVVLLKLDFFTSLILAAIIGTPFFWYAFVFPLGTHMAGAFAIALVFVAL